MRALSFMYVVRAICSIQSSYKAVTTYTFMYMSYSGSTTISCMPVVTH